MSCQHVPLFWNVTDPVKPLNSHSAQIIFDITIWNGQCLFMHGRARTISNCYVKLDLRRIISWELSRACHDSENWDVLKRHSLAFLLSLLSCFFCLDSLFWHGLVSLNLAISTQHKLHNYSAQIVFDMHEFKLFPFIHALRYHCVFGIKWKKRKCSW